jgi:internalin A
MAKYEVSKERESRGQPSRSRRTKNNAKTRLRPDPSRPPLDIEPPVLDADGMETSKKRPWRTYLRFSLRGLIVLVLGIGAWLGWMVHTARVQRDAVAAIQKIDGIVRYDRERKGGRSFPNGKTWGPRWLVDRIGIDYFGHVTQVRLVATQQLSDTELIHISHLRRLEELDLHRSPVTDAGLAHLEGLTELQSLHLFHTEVSDAGLVRLRGLARLRNLSIENTKVTDAGVQELQKALPNLTVSR